MDEPLAWWDSLSDETVAFWSAYWRVEPWGCEWERHSELMSTLDHIYGATVNQFAKEGEAYKPFASEAFMPDDFLRDKKRKKKVDFSQQFNNFVMANSR